MNKKFLSIAICSLFVVSAAFSQNGRWTVAKANEWYAKQGWLRGSNFQPSTAINQLEMSGRPFDFKSSITRLCHWGSS